MKLLQILMPSEPLVSSKYVVTLTPDERTELTGLVRSGRPAARTILHAQVLLTAAAAAAGPGWTDERIREAFGIGRTAIARIRRRFVEESLEAALDRRPAQTARPRKLDGRAEAHLVALAGSAPPDGQARWTLHLLTDHFVALGVSDPVSDATVRRVWKKTP